MTSPDKSQTINNKVVEEKDKPKEDKPKEDKPKEQSGSLRFSDSDTVLDLNTNKKSIVDAPKTLERLEKISLERHAQRKAEEEKEEEEEEDDKLVIHNNTALNLDKIDIHDLDKKINTKPDPILDDIEVLS